MCPQPKNKLLTAGIALGVAGILACTAAMLEVLLPRQSPAAFAGTLVVLGLVVVGLVAGFAWLCERLSDYFNAPIDKRLMAGKRDGPTGAAESDLRIRNVGQERDAPDPLEPRPLRGRYPTTLHGFVPPEDRLAAGWRAWHGQ
jgi:hypothetical protein